jgi:hypothetical protein
MSVMVLERGLTPESAVADGMPRGIVLSGAMHLAILAAIIIGLPTLFRPAIPEDQPIAVELVTIAPETHATHPNPNTPKADAKPDIPVPAPPAPKPEPNPHPPPPSPAPPQPEAKPTPPPPPPPPRPVEAQAPPPPPPKPPEPKPKPQPPKQLAEAQPKPPDTSKANEMAFDSLLKNLSKQAAVHADDAPPRPQRTVAAAPPSSQPKAPLGSQLTASEIDLVREQLARCWNINAGARDAKDLVVEIRAVVNPDGTVTRATIVDQGRANGDPLYRAAAESARRAFFNPACTPLKLPPEKYATWKDLVVDFSPKDIQ